MPENFNILVVDDSAMQRDMIKQVLDLEKYKNVHTAIDGLDALKLLNNNFYHLIITDINMPNMDGFSLVQELRKKDFYKTIPIIIITSDNSNATKTKGFLSGASAWIKKPLTKNTLLQVINTLLRKK